MNIKIEAEDYQQRIDLLERVLMLLAELDWEVAVVLVQVTKNRSVQFLLGVGEGQTLSFCSVGIPIDFVMGDKEVFARVIEDAADYLNPQMSKLGEESDEITIRSVRQDDLGAWAEVAHYLDRLDDEA